MNSKTIGITFIILAIFLLSITSSFASTETEASVPMGVTIGTANKDAGNNNTATGGPSLNIPVSVDLSDTYTTITAKRLVESRNNTLTVIAELPMNYTEVLLHLPRAEQDDILGLDPKDAIARLSQYKLVNRSRYDLYSERHVPSGVFESAPPILDGSKASKPSFISRLKLFLARIIPARGQGINEEAMEIDRDYLLDTINIYIRAAETIKYNAEINDDLTVEEADSIIENAKSKIGVLQALQLRVVDATTQAEISSLKKEVSAIAEQLGPSIKSDALELIRSRLLDIVKRDEQMERKLECTIDSMKATGKDTSLIEEKFGELSAKIYFAKNDIKSAKEQAAAGNFTSAETKTYSAQLKLEEAYISLKDIVKDIRASNSTIAECQAYDPNIITVAEELP